jgi:predicted lipoprotein with Yx(FWY)xxD motif
MNKLQQGMLLSTVFFLSLSLASAAIIYGNSNASSVSTTSSAPQYSVNLSYNVSVGNYLTNATGFSLYMYTPDTPYSGNSTCYGGCAKAWPPFYTSTLSLPQGLNASEFGTITRTDGTKQTTYMGYPLYFYAYDKQAGQTNGQGVGHVWYLLTASGPTMPTAHITNSNTTTAPSTNNTSGVGIAGNIQRAAVNQSNSSTASATTTPTSSTSQYSSGSGSSNLPLYLGIIVVVIIILAIVAYFAMHKK